MVVEHKPSRSWRRATYTATALSATLLLAVTVLWIRSHWRGDRYTHAFQRHTFYSISGSGGILLQFSVHSRFAPFSNLTTYPNPIYPDPMRDFRHTKRFANLSPSTQVVAVAPVELPKSTTMPFSNANFDMRRKVELPSDVSTAPLNVERFSITLWPTTVSEPQSAKKPDLWSGSLPSSLATTSGTLTIGFTMLVPAVPDAEPWKLSQWLGIYAYSSGDTQPLSMMRSYVLILPYWLIVAVLAIATLLAVLSSIRARRRNLFWTQGHCQTCGYDLRESPERCPECGTTCGA
jgi:hypothetical protein